MPLPCCSMSAPSESAPGVQARARQGNASSAAAAALASDSVLASLAQSALSIISAAEAGAPLFNLQGAGAAPGASPHPRKNPAAASSSSSSAAAAAGGGGGKAGRPAAKSASSSSGAAGGAGASAGASATNNTTTSRSTTATPSSSSSRGQSRAPLLGAPSPKAAAYVAQLRAFLEECVYPVEQLLEEHHRWVWGVGCGVWGVGCGVWGAGGAPSVGVGCGVWGAGGLGGEERGWFKTWRGTRCQVLCSLILIHRPYSSSLPPAPEHPCP
jgi:hypothetical protein